ncbi:MAG: glycosyltransferase family 2 protein [Hydrogenophilales bacterium]|nr:glycosyltransferase family 2 protein [Hydrogenophilales bacterium]
MPQTFPGAACEVVIVNYNAGPVLTEAVRAILPCPSVREVIVVDNRSQDGSVEHLESALPGETRLRVIRNSGNLGFAAGCNTAMAFFQSPYQLFINPDCLVDPLSIGEMIGTLELNPDAGMAGPLLVNTDGSEQSGGRRGVPTPWRSFVRAFGLSRFSNRYPRLFSDFLMHKEPLPDRPIDIEAISGACMLVRNRALLEVGPLDAGYFMHCEDLDWCMRFRQRGWKILFVPEARVVHYLGACSRSRPIFVEWHKHKGMMRFYRKFFRHQYPGVLMWLVALGVWLRFGVLVLYYLGQRLGRALGA